MSGRIFLRGDTMEIMEVRENKKKYMDLLLLADEDEKMIDRYIERGSMYVLDDNGIKAECVVTDEDGVLEIKNIAVAPEYQKMGYGRRLIDFVESKYKDRYTVMRVGTGDSPLTVPFYERLGFKRAYVIKNFFADNYERSIIEAGVRLTDMICLEKSI